MEHLPEQHVFPPAPPKNWLAESILVTIFCCLPFGIVGIVNAAQVNSKFHAGDYVGAEQSSREAGKWTKIGFFVGLGLLLLYILGVALGVATFSLNGRTYGA
jgi:hypothetical protein